MSSTAGYEGNHPSSRPLKRKDVKVMFDYECNKCGRDFPSPISPTLTGRKRPRHTASKCIGDPNKRGYGHPKETGQ
jgi:hypothetical protein